MEFVYVVPRGELFPDHTPQGFRAFGGADGLSLERFRATVRERGFFVERPYAERTPTLKQVIPYSIVRTREADGDRILLLRRLPTGGERRLHDKLSIGVGGHLNPVDLGASGGQSPSEAPSDRDVVAAGTRRELEEELAIEGSWSARPIGILNDDSNPVGAVHVGLAQIVTVDGRVSIREADQLEGRCVPPAELRALLSGGADFETWSRLLIHGLDALLGAVAPARIASTPPSPSAPLRDAPERTVPSR